MTKRKTRVCEISVRLVKGVCVECYYSGEEQSSEFRLDKYGLKLSAHLFWEILHVR